MAFLTAVLPLQAKVEAPEFFQALPPALEAPRSVLPTLAPLMEEIVKTPEELIIDYAVENGVDSRIPLEIAKAESGLNATATNPNSSASGLFQFIDDTFKRQCIETYNLTDTMKDKNNPKVQAECAVLMIKDGGLSHWDASRKYWQNKIGAGRNIAP